MGSSVILPPPGQPKTGPDPNFKSSALPNLVTFEWQNVPPPSPLYIQRDDVLVIQATPKTPQTVTINVRLLAVPFEQGGQPLAMDGSGQKAAVYNQGVILPIQRVLTSTLPYQEVFLQIPLTEGYLLACSATAQSTGERGATFARAFLIRGAQTFPTPGSFQVLFADYITGLNPVGWPGGRILGTTEGPGNIYTVTVSNPAAGTDWSYTPNPNTRTQILSFTAQLVTAIAAATRIVRVELDDPLGNQLMQCPPNATQVASQTVLYSGFPDAPPTIADPATILIGLPNPTMIQFNSTLSTDTSGLQAADQWSLIEIQVMEWLDNV